MAENEMEWARDAALVELKRAFPEAVDRVALQEATGLGTEDMRTALDMLEKDGALEEDPDGFRLSDAGYDPETAPAGQTYAPIDEEGAAEGLLPDPDALEGDPPPEAPAAPEIVPERPETLLADGPVADSRYTTVLAVEITAYPELQEQESGDTAALREAVEFSEALDAFLEEKWPGIPARVVLRSVAAYDNPRYVFGQGD